MIAALFGHFRCLDEMDFNNRAIVRIDARSNSWRPLPSNQFWLHLDALGLRHLQWQPCLETKDIDGTLCL